MTVNANLTIEQAHALLNGIDPNNQKQSIGPTVQKLVKDLEKSLDEKKLLEAWKLVERIPIVSDGYGISNEMAEARVCCACAACRLGNLKKSAALLKEAAGLYYSERHQEGVVRWMLGCVYWQLSGFENKAIHTWRDSIRIYKSRSANIRFMDGKHIKWYEETIEKMRNDLKNAIDHPGKRALWIYEQDETSINTDNGKFAQKMEPSITEKTSTLCGEEIVDDKIPHHKNHTDLPEAFLVEWPVLAEIPAGTPYDRLLLPDSESKTSQLLIDDQLFSVHNLHGNSGNQIKISENDRYFFLRVRGDSMDLAGVNGGDFVLMRRESYAKNGDIVAVVVSGHGEEATLKRFARTTETIQFRPESTNEKHDILEFGHLDESFHVHGIVVAVLKPDESD
ncbi:MAG: hypothetical protein H8D34_05845 [Chloroflexi bacterium]|nr:hypothetical protein [Chloroflexota bacterium]